MSDIPLLPARAHFLGAPATDDCVGAIGGWHPTCVVDVLDGPYTVPKTWPLRPDGTRAACLVCGSRHLVMTVEGLPGDDFQSACLCRLKFIDGEAEPIHEMALDVLGDE